jgi:hypothetical protein
MSRICPSLFIGCGVGHQDFISSENHSIGKKVLYDKFRFKHYNLNLTIGFRKGGYGITHITYNKKGNIIQHWYSEEILPNKIYPEAVGKCKTYSVIDPKTRIIKAWGFEKDSNPLSCRTWM